MGRLAEVEEEEGAKTEEEVEEDPATVPTDRGRPLE